MMKDNMRHAWLIIAHNEFEILQMLVSAIDAPDSDIFVHIDKKVKDLPVLKADKCSLRFLGNRVDVRWGSVSQIECEMVLMEETLRHGPYDYYHIISGTTLPLVSGEDLERFFESNSGNSILTGLCHDDPYQETLKVRRTNLFLKNYTAKGFLGRASQFLWKASIALQRVFGIERNRGMEFYKASNWLSLTQEAVEYIVARKQLILKTFRCSFCGDEYFIPTELMASPLKDKVINSDNYLKREIARSTASVFSLDDLPGLRNSGYLFARKFTSK